jgi:hypothetical protein
MDANTETRGTTKVGEAVGTRRDLGAWEGLGEDATYSLLIQAPKSRRAYTSAGTESSAKKSADRMKRQRRERERLQRMEGEYRDLVSATFTAEEDAAILSKPVNMKWDLFRMLVCGGRYTKDAIRSRYRVLMRGSSVSRGKRWTVAEDMELLRGEHPRGRTAKARRERLLKLRKLTM